MAPRPKLATRQPANLSAAQMIAAVPKIERRIAELKAVDVAAINADADLDRLEAQRLRIDDTLMEIYGSDSQDYYRYRITSLDDTVDILTMTLYESPPPKPISHRQSGIQTGIGRAIMTLESALSMLKERMGDSGEDGGARAVRAYGGLDLHPEIARSANKLYQDGHYANAVEAAVKRLNAMVRMRSDLEVDGTTLVERAFSPSNPILRFNALADQSDKDEQKGFMMMFSGAVSGLRNPRAHGFIKDDPERALEFIAFVSLLAKLLEGAERV
jgi:uncharacterized protein (TIGR02391 family)